MGYKRVFVLGMCIAPSKFLLLTSEGAASPDGATPRNALNSEVSMNFDLVMLCTYSAIAIS